MIADNPSAAGLVPGVLWLSIIAELLYVVLLLTGNILMSVEICSYSSVIDGLKINAFSAVVTVLAGTAQHLLQSHPRKLITLPTFQNPYNAY